jgi:hypothetical protein
MLRVKVLRASKRKMFYGRNGLVSRWKIYLASLDRYIRWYNEKRIKLSLVQ